MGLNSEQTEILQFVAKAVAKRLLQIASKKKIIS
jgi:hypothetical protein